MLMTRKRQRSGTAGNSFLRIRIHGTRRVIAARFLETLSFLFLLAGVFAIPVVFSSSVSSGYLLPKYYAYLITGVISFGLLASSAALKRTFSFKISAVTSSLVLFLFAYMVSTIFSAQPLTSILGTHGSWIFSLVSMLVFFLLFVTTSSVITSPARQNVFLWILTLSTLLVASIHINDFLFFNSVSETAYEATTTLSSPTALTVFLLAGTASTLILMNSTESTLLRLTQAFIGVLLAVTMFVTGNPLLSVTGMVFILGIFIYLTVKKRHVRNGLLALMAILFLVSCILPFLNLPVELPRSQDPEYLLSTLHTTIIATAHSPILGSSPEMLNLQAAHYITDKFLETQFWNEPIFQAPNLYITFMGSIGIPGGIACIAGAIIIISSFVQTFRRRKSNKLFFLSLATLWIITLSISPSTPTTLFLGALLLGAASNYITARTIQIHTSGNSWIAGLILICTVILILPLTRNYQAEKYYFSSLSAEPSASIPLINKATELNQLEPVYYRTRATILTEYITTTENNLNGQETIRQIENSHENAATISPNDQENYRTAALNLQTLSSSLGKEYYLLLALSNASTAIDLSPKDPSLYTMRGSIFADLGKNDDAFQDFNTAIDLKHNYWEGYLLAAYTAVEMGDTDRAIDYLAIVLDESKDADALLRAEILLGFTQ